MNFNEPCIHTLTQFLSITDVSELPVAMTTPGLSNNRMCLSNCTSCICLQHTNYFVTFFMISKKTLSFSPIIINFITVTVCSGYFKNYLDFKWKFWNKSMPDFSGHRPATECLSRQTERNIFLSVRISAKSLTGPL